MAVRNNDPIVDCTCSPQRPHGTPGGHGRNLHKCGCEPCRESFIKWRKRIAWGRANGTGPRVPAGRARDWLLLLKARGLTWSGISQETGIDPAILSRLASGTAKETSPEKIQKIMAVKLPSR